ncbi:PAS domain S-box-containing protein [Desulfonatronum thiosulfatophilum]|uniref:histidine kinase n=1 Tax=Desulfonatronum thiosulfatophilum TaxID=617002 RepID=A0A1G6BPF9_9BACT|nr:PAS domain-containing protein [Desulfonatronum thiosulfatophilum]SDB22468.1 PAS domain S-box-containing protein [Desulfonatronum thiosulfatophilum]
MPEISRQLNLHISSRTAILYALFAGMWIFFSDALLAMIVVDPEKVRFFQTYKGWMFVVVTAFLLYFILRKQVLLLEQKSRQLIQQERRFRDLVDNAPLPIFIQTEGMFVYLNKEAQELYGAESPEDLLGSSVLDVVHPAHHQDVREKIRLLNERNTVPSQEQVHLSRDGRELAVEVNAVPLRFQEQDGAVVFAQNVTDRRRNEQELRRNLALVTAILENSPNLISLVDRQGHFVLVSRELAKIIGKEPAMIVGQKFDRFYAQDVVETFKQRITKVIETNSSFMVVDKVDSETEEKFYETCLFPVEVDQDRVELVGVISMDVTERVLAQEKIQFRHDLMHYVIHHDPSAIAVHDRELKYIYVSQRYLDDYGIKEDVVGRHHYEIFPEIPEKWKDVHRRALHGEVLQNDDDSFFRPDGNLEHTRWQCRPWFASDGSIGGIVLYSEVITELKRVETELRELNLQLEQRVQERTIQLEEINRELEAFSYSVSHDLRAPLRSIVGFSQALLEDYYDRFDATGRDYLQRVIKAGQRMGLLIDDLLKLSRVSRAELAMTNVDLSLMAREILRGHAVMDPGRNVETVVQDELLAHADPALIRIVMENLLDNAWKFTRYRSPARIEFGRQLLNDEPVFFLRDNGAGFNMAYADKLFIAFQRLHSLERFPGTGIGLATTARIIRRHNGKIWAEAEPDQGATFRFTLPIPSQDGNNRERE